MEVWKQNNHITVDDIRINSTFSGELNPVAQAVTAAFNLWVAPVERFSSYRQRDMTWLRVGGGGDIRVGVG